MHDGLVPTAGPRVAAEPLRRPRRRRSTRSRRVVALTVGPLLVLGVGAVVALPRLGPGASPTPDALGGAVVPPAAAFGDVSTVGTDTMPPLDGALPVDVAPADVAPPVGADPGSARAALIAPTTVSASDIHRLMARRTTALRTRNEKAFLATFDASRASLVATERTLFRNLVKLPLVSPTYRESGVSGTSTKRRSYVSLAHQFRGVDAEAAELSKVETYVRRNGVVVTTSVAALPGQPNTRYAPLDQGPLTVRTTPRVTVVGTPEVTDLATVATVAEKAAAAVRASWGSRPGPSRFIVFATTDQRAVRSWFGTSNTPFQAAGATMVQIALYHQTRYAGARVVLDLTQARGDDLYRVLRHEFMHAADVRVQTVPPRGAVQNVPSWAEEGQAAWFEERDVALRSTDTARTLKSLRRYWSRTLPPSTRASFYTDDDRGQFNYALAASIFRYIEVRYGTAKAINFYVAVAQGRQTAAYSSLGRTRTTFTRDWVAWVNSLIAT